MPGSDDVPVSAARLAEVLGDALPAAGSVPAAAYDLVAEARQLVEAIVMTDVSPEERAAVAAELARLSSRLNRRRRHEAFLLVRHPDGRVESLLQAGSGRLNPQAPPLEWVHRPTEPPRGAEPVPTDVLARCTFTAAHGGSPGRVYGGVVALVLDEVLGGAATAAGASGMTVALSVSLLAATPFGVRVDIAGRYMRSEGRKRFVEGEVTVDGVRTAEATAVLVSERRA